MLLWSLNEDPNLKTRIDAFNFY